MATHDEIRSLGIAARYFNQLRVDPEDCIPTEAETECLNAFTEHLEEVLPRKVWNEYCDWCLKATDTEVVDEGLRLLALTKED